MLQIPYPQTNRNVVPQNLQDRHFMSHIQSQASEISWADSFPRQNLKNSVGNLVNSAAHRGKADEIPRLTADTQ